MVYVAVIAIIVLFYFLIKWSNNENKKYEKQTDKVRVTIPIKIENENPITTRAENKNVDRFYHSATSEHGNYRINFDKIDYQLPKHYEYDLYFKNKIIKTGKLKDPEDIRIANNGSFIISGGFGDKRWTIITIYNKIGELLFKRVHRMGINTFNISQDGNYVVWFHYTKDDGKFTFYDVANKIQVFSKKSPIYLPSDFEIDTKLKMINWIYKKYVTTNKYRTDIFRFTFDGKFLDKEAWEIYQNEI